MRGALVEESDRNLVVRAQNGDREAFRMLVDRYQRKAYSVAFSMVRNADDAMDITQEAFLKVYKSLDGFQHSSGFYTWLYRIVVNLCIDHLRKSGRFQNVDYDDKLKHDDDDGGDVHDVIPNRLDGNPDKVIARKELAAQMEKALSSLSPDHRTAILLREVEGMSYEEMAEAMSVPKGTIMSRLHHARRNMQKFLSEYVGRKPQE